MRQLIFTHLTNIIRIDLQKKKKNGQLGVRLSPIIPPLRKLAHGDDRCF